MRSPHAHARIIDIDVTDAIEVPGVVAIYTWEDLPGAAAEPLPVLIPHPALHAPRTGYPLARDDVHHVGEPIVMVVAENRYLAEDAAGRIRVDYQVLPVVVGIAGGEGGGAQRPCRRAGQRGGAPGADGRRRRRRDRPLPRTGSRWS